MVNCPHCGATRVLQDEPPVRGYVLVSLGALMLFAGSFLDPSIFAEGILAEYGRLAIFGGVVFAFGGYLLFKHPNRYCGICGFRFREVPGGYVHDGAADQNTPRGPGSRIEDAMKKAEVKMQQAESKEALAKAGFPQVVKTSSDKVRSLDRNQPIKPLLACLKFRDPKQRTTAAQTLRELTGQDLPAEHDAWAQWWEENKEAYKAARRSADHG